MKGELIGKVAKVIYNNRVFEGIIADETKNTIVMWQYDRKVTLLKQNSVIFIDEKKIQGKSIMKRPEDRIKEC